MFEGNDETTDTPEGDGVENLDPAARDEAGDQAAEGATETSQDVDAPEVEQTPHQAGAVDEDGNPLGPSAPAPPEWQSGTPDPGDTEQDRAPTQTAGGSTDGLSPNTTSDEGAESDDAGDGDES